jgi:putative glutamine amidotransferase
MGAEPACGSDAAFERALDYALETCDGFIFTGGDDPKTEPFGEPTDPRTTPVYDRRQTFETGLLRALAPGGPDRPVLGVCLGMQMMALVRGGAIEQYLPDHLATHAEHWDREHPIIPVAGGSMGGGALSAGVVLSKHKQAVRDPGPMVVTATAPDGTIEAIRDPDRRFAIGVQWHPERTRDDAVGDALFRELVREAQMAPS